MKFEAEIHEHLFVEDKPFDNCHASTLILLPGGDILTAYFAGTREGDDDVAIWCSKRTGGKWAKPKKVADKEGVPHWNPVLYRDDDGTIYLFYKIGHEIPKWHTMLTTSIDNGETWTTPRELVEGDEGGRGPVKNKLIKLHDGTWLAPASVEGEYWNAFTDISRDKGTTWVKSAMVPLERSCSQNEGGIWTHVFKDKGVIQPTLWESTPGTVHMLLRSTEGLIFRSDSSDNGNAWCQAYPAGLPNNNSGIDLVKMDNGTLALAYNPVCKNWGQRTPLVISLSHDNGLTWEGKITLEDQMGEYSYPAIVSSGSSIFVTYTWKRESIAFWKIMLV